MPLDPLSRPSLGSNGAAADAGAHSGLSALSPGELAEKIRRRALGASRATGISRSSLPHLVQNPELAWLHRNWQLPLSFQPAPVAPGLAGLRDRIRNRLARVSYGYLQRYLSQNQDIVANTVRVIDAIAKRFDRMSEAEQRHYRELREEMDEILAHLRLLGDARPAGLLGEHRSESRDDEADDDTPGGQ